MRLRHSGKHKMVLSEASNSVEGSFSRAILTNDEFVMLSDR
jgi:hypothetical protein